MSDTTTTARLSVSLILCLFMQQAPAQETKQVGFLEVDVPEGWKTTALSTPDEGPGRIELLRRGDAPLIVTLRTVTHDAGALEPLRERGALAALEGIRPLVDHAAETYATPAVLQQVMITFDTVEVAGQRAPAARAVLPIEGLAFSCRGALLVQPDGRGVLAVVTEIVKQGDLHKPHPHLAEAYAILETLRFRDPGEPVTPPKRELQTLDLDGLKLEVPASWTHTKIPVGDGVVHKLTPGSQPLTKCLVSVSHETARTDAQRLAALEGYSRASRQGMCSEPSKAIHLWETVELVGEEARAIRSLMPCSLGGGTSRQVHVLQTGILFKGDCSVQFTVMDLIEAGKVVGGAEFQQDKLALYRALATAKLGE